MEWSHSLFVAFMASVVGVLWWIALEVNGLRKELRIEARSRERRRNEPPKEPKRRDRSMR